MLRFGFMSRSTSYITVRFAFLRSQYKWTQKRSKLWFVKAATCWNSYEASDTFPACKVMFFVSNSAISKRSVTYINGCLGFWNSSASRGRLAGHYSWMMIGSDRRCSVDIQRTGMQRLICQYHVNIKTVTKRKSTHKVKKKGKAISVTGLGGL
jgi:hypothetical protein